MARDPVDDLVEAVEVAQEVIEAVGTEQWALPTPCPEWEVRQLVEHLVSGNRLFASALTGEEGPAPRPEGTADGPVEAYRTSARDLVAAFRRPGALEATVTVPFGTVPGAIALHLRTTELLVHAWDLAAATAQRRSFPDALAEQELAFTEPALGAIPPERRPFGPPQPAPADAPAIDRLAACLGRSVTA